MPNLINGVKNFISDRVYEVQATAKVLKADQDGNGKLNLDEYAEVSFFEGDNFFARHQRGFEFSVIDELKNADGQVSIGELAKFYKKLDANNDGESTMQEYDAAMHKSSFAVKAQYPLAAAASSVGHWSNQLMDLLTKPRD